MGKSFKYIGRGRDNRSFENPLISSGRGLGRNNKFTSPKEDRRQQRRNKQRQRQFEGAADW